jgi:hypothetical protein
MDERKKGGGGIIRKLPKIGLSPHSILKKSDDNKTITLSNFTGGNLQVNCTKNQNLNVETNIRNMFLDYCHDCTINIRGDSSVQRVELWKCHDIDINSEGSLNFIRTEYVNDVDIKTKQTILVGTQASGGITANGSSVVSDLFGDNHILNEITADGAHRWKNVRHMPRKRTYSIKITETGPVLV